MTIDDKPFVKRVLDRTDLDEAGVVDYFRSSPFTPDDVLDIIANHECMFAEQQEPYLYSEDILHSVIVTEIEEWLMG